MKRNSREQTAKQNSANPPIRGHHDWICTWNSSITDQTAKIPASKKPATGPKMLKCVCAMKCPVVPQAFAALRPVATRYSL